MEIPSTSKSNTRPGYSSIGCRNCGDEIYFDDNHLSKNGKKVPLNKMDGKPHQCLNRPFPVSKSVNAGPCGPTTSPTRIDTTEPILAEILRIVRRIEKNTSKSPLCSGSAYDPEGGS